MILGTNRESVKGTPSKGLHWQGYGDAYAGGMLGAGRRLQSTVFKVGLHNTNIREYPVFKVLVQKSRAAGISSVYTKINF